MQNRLVTYSSTLILSFTSLVQVAKASDYTPPPAWHLELVNNEQMACYTFDDAKALKLFFLNDEELYTEAVSAKLEIDDLQTELLDLQTANAKLNLALTQLKALDATDAADRDTAIQRAEVEHSRSLFGGGWYWLVGTLVIGVTGGLIAGMLIK